MSNPVIDAIMRRRSVRAYKPDPLTDEQIKTLTDAALASPSGMNAQPWHITVLRDKAIMDEIQAKTADFFESEGNVELAGRMRGGGLFYGAPVSFFISTPRDNPSPTDVGILVENIAIAAAGLGLGSVILGLPRAAFTGENDAPLCAKLCYPEGYAHGLAVAVGYPADDGAPHALAEGKVVFVG